MRLGKHFADAVRTDEPGTIHGFFRFCAFGIGVPKEGLAIAAVMDGATPNEEVMGAVAAGGGQQSKDDGGQKHHPAV